jgi:ribosome-binding protein aMBF1 (putative translation factor)
MEGMSPEQCRAARAWIGWSMDDLAKRAHLSASTVRDFEAGRREPIFNNLRAIKFALEAEGIAFLENPDGVARVIRKTGTAGARVRKKEAVSRI